MVNRMSVRCYVLAIGVLVSTEALAGNPAVTVAIDATANRHAINPQIYGVAFGSKSDLKTLNAPLNRMGGNSMTAYNWKQNATNLAQDWYFESYPQDGGGDLGRARRHVRLRHQEPERAADADGAAGGLGGEAGRGTLDPARVLGRQIRRAMRCRSLRQRRGRRARHRLLDADHGQRSARRLYRRLHCARAEMDPSPGQDLGEIENGRRAATT